METAPESVPTPASNPAPWTSDGRKQHPYLFTAHCEPSSQVRTCRFGSSAINGGLVRRRVGTTLRGANPFVMMQSAPLHTVCRAWYTSSNSASPSALRLSRPPFRHCAVLRESNVLNAQVTADPARKLQHVLPDLPRPGAARSLRWIHCCKRCNQRRALRTDVRSPTQTPKSL